MDKIVTSKITKIALIIITFALFFNVLRLRLDPQERTVSLPQTKGLSAQNFVVFQKITSKIKPSASVKTNFTEGDTALDLLKKTVDFKTHGEGKSAFVLEIDNIKADDNKSEFWAFYVNGKLAEVGAGSYHLKNNDKIEWKLENY
jgi:hypothetical protein